MIWRNPNFKLLFAEDSIITVVTYWDHLGNLDSIIIIVATNRDHLGNFKLLSTEDIA